VTEDLAPQGEPSGLTVTVWSALDKRAMSEEWNKSEARV
jgi:hypothetical protein